MLFLFGHIIPKDPETDLEDPDSHVGFHQFEDTNGQPYGSFRVFAPSDEAGLEAGYYWCVEFPGCLSDGEPMGPFDSSKEAWEDAIDS